jgi:hypothetical protein
MWDFSGALAVVALVISVVALWRTELRGSNVRCLPVPDSTVVALGPVPGAENAPDERNLVNVWRTLVFVNESARAAYLSRIVCTSMVSPLPGVSRLDVGVTQAHPRPITPQAHHRMDVVVQRDQPVRVDVSWWLVVEASHIEVIRDAIQDPRGQLWMEIEWATLESFLVWPRFKTRKLQLRPKADKTELIAWRGEPYGL